MKEIALHTGEIALVDDEDYELAIGYKWYRHTAGYAIARPKVMGKRITLFMHRLILGLRPGELVDHINHNPLDNRRSNLRKASCAQNTYNAASHNRWGYKGVTRCIHHGSPSKPWRARITVGGRTIYLGCYATAEQAGLAYNEAAVKYYGEYACLNIIPEHKEVAA